MSTSSVMLWICKIPRFVSPWQTNVLPTIIHADKMWIQNIIWVIVGHLFQGNCSEHYSKQNHWFISLKSPTKSVLLKTHLRRMDSPVKKSLKDQIVEPLRSCMGLLVRYNAKRISRPKLYWFDWMKPSYIILFHRIRVHRPR